MNKLKKNIAYNLIYQVLSIILPFITAPYLSRVVGADGIGVYSFSHSIALYFTYLTLLGLTNYGNRSIASVQSDYDKRSDVFCEIFGMQCICFTISICAYIIYIIFFSKDKIAALIMGFTVISSLFDINWFFFGMEKFKLTVTRNSIIKISTVIAILCIVKNENDIYKYITIMSIGTLLSQISLWPFVFKLVKIHIPSFKNIAKHFKQNFVLFIPVIAVSIYKMMDKVFLGEMSSMSQVGYYENAERIITIAATMITAVGTVMMPRTAKLISEDRVKESIQYLDKSMLIVIAYCNAVVFGVISVAKEFAVVFYGEKFEMTGTIMCYLAITVLFLGCGNVIRTQYLIPNKMDKIFINSAILGAGVNVIINSLLIPSLEAIGAAIGTIFAEFIVLLYQSIYCKGKINFVKYCKWEFVFSCIGVLMMGLIYIIPPIENSILHLFIQIIIGGLFYTIFSVLYITKIEKLNIKN